MPIDPNIDLRGAADFYQRGVDVGSSVAARGHSLGMARTELGMRMADRDRQLSDADASNEVFRTLATEYLMQGFGIEDFAADNMPESDMGRVAAARGMGRYRKGFQAWGQGPSVDASSMPGLADPGAGSNAPAGFVPAGVIGGMVQNDGGGMGPPVDQGQLPGVRSATSASAGMVREHPDDTRLRLAISKAPAQAIQAIMPYLQSEKKRRAFTSQLNELIQEGLDESVVTPHLASIIKLYGAAGEAELGVGLLADAYSQHSSHLNRMDELRVRGDNTLSGIEKRGEQNLEAIDRRAGHNIDAINTRAKNAETLEDQRHDNRVELQEQKDTSAGERQDKALAQQRQQFDRRQSETERHNQETERAARERIDAALNKPNATGVIAAARMGIQQAKEGVSAAEKRYRGLNEHMGGKGLSPPTDADRERLQHPATTKFGDGVSDMSEADYAMLRAKVALWDEIVRSHRKLDAAYDEGKKAASTAAAPARRGKADDLADQLIDEVLGENR